MLDPAALVRRACASAGGGIAIMAALSLTAMIGFASLGTEVSLVYYKQSQMQSAASSAALGAAAALMAGQTSAYSVKEAQAIAASAGFTGGMAGATVTVNNPPKSGTHEIATAIEVIIAQPQPALLSSLFFAGPWNISARAVASAGNSTADCVLVLDTGSYDASSSTVAAYLSNGAVMTLTNCGFADNASGSDALRITGAQLKPQAVTITGSYDLTSGGGGTITTSPTANNIKTGQAATVNPYAGVAVPAPGSCTYGSLPTSGTFVSASRALVPGTYCGGLTISAGTVTMKSGTYIIDGGYFSVTGGTLTSLSGGVTIVLTGSGTNYAYLTTSGGGKMTLTALATGATAGMLIFQDPAEPTTATGSEHTSSFGPSTVSLTGALYFPTQVVNYSNSVTATATGCTQLVAWQILFAGGATFANGCSGTGVKAIGATLSTLVE